MSTTAVETTTFSADATPSDGDIGITTTSITGITTTNIEIGDTVKLLTGVIGSGTTVTGISTANGGTVTISPATLNAVSLDNVELSFGAYSTTTTLAAPEVGYGVTQAISAVLPGVGTTRTLDGHLKGIITRVGSGEVDVKVLSHVSAAGTETNVDYQPSGVYKFSGSGTVAIHTSSQTVSYGTTAVTAQKDW
jgi:hypothetical protein